MWGSRVADSSYSGYTKSSLKIYQIYTIFICIKKNLILINNCCWAVGSQSSAINLAASSISDFLSSAVTGLLTNGRFTLLTPATTVSFLLWPTVLLCCIIAALRFAVFFLRSLQKGYTAPAETCFASHANSVNHSSLNLLPLSYAEPSSLFSELFISLPVSFSAYPKCTLTPMWSKITQLFLHSFNITMVSLFTLCNIKNSLVYRLNKTLRQQYTKNIPNFSYIPIKNTVYMPSTSKIYQSHLPDWDAHSQMFQKHSWNPPLVGPDFTPPSCYHVVFRATDLGFQ